MIDLSVKIFLFDLWFLSSQWFYSSRWRHSGAESTLHIQSKSPILFSDSLRRVVFWLLGNVFMESYMELYWPVQCLLWKGLGLFASRWLVNTLVNVCCLPLQVFKRLERPLGLQTHQQYFCLTIYPMKMLYHDRITTLTKPQNCVPVSEVHFIHFYLGKVYSGIWCFFYRNNRLKAVSNAWLRCECPSLAYCLKCQPCCLFHTVFQSTLLMHILLCHSVSGGLVVLHATFKPHWWRNGCLPRLLFRAHTQKQSC